VSEEQYASEFECDPFAAILGAYYGKDIAACEAEGRITDLPPEPGVPVHTAWDIGHRHSTAIWFFQVVTGLIVLGKVETKQARLNISRRPVPDTLSRTCS
jgi:hypothetical protein